MKQFKIVKLVYADTMMEALTKERDGVIVDGALFDEYLPEDWEAHLERKRMVRLNSKMG